VRMKPSWVIGSMALFAVMFVCSANDTPTHTGEAELQTKSSLSKPLVTQPIHKSQRKPQDTTFAVRVSLRPFPYPYQAMLAIASDADHETLRKFNLVHQFLNTHDKTIWGTGLGLDISDSFFMYNGTNVNQYVDFGKQPMSHELTYFQGVSSQPYGAQVIDHYIHVGWMDSIHTYGDFSMQDEHQTEFTRSLAVQGAAALAAHGDNVSVWIDHGNMSNVDDFGSYGFRPFFNYQQGANPNSEYYHTDLTIPYGIHFVWTGLASDAFGRSTMIYPIQLPDGRSVWGFWRYTNSAFDRLGDPEWDWSPDALSVQLTKENLTDLVQRHQFSIVAQHLSGKDSLLPLPTNAVDALKTLAQFYDSGEVLVARTSRLLQYNVVRDHIRYQVSSNGRETIINIKSVEDPVLGTYVPTVDALRGITFYTRDPEMTTIEINGVVIPHDMIQDNPFDGVARSIEICWYPPDTTDYTQTDPAVY